MNVDRVVKCPQCASEFIYKKSKFRPFCSKKCKLIDLGCWLNEEYAIHGESAEHDEPKESDEVD